MHFLKFQYADRPVFINQFLSLIGGPRINWLVSWLKLFEQASSSHKLAHKLSSQFISGLSLA